MGITHFALAVDKLDDTSGKLEKIGIEFISPLETSPDGKAIVAFCKDPEGNYIKLVQEVK